jgi:signal transduction histidine kinase
MLLTGLTLVVDIRNGTQPLDEITEVPLMAAMFVAMVWHAQRRLSMQRHVEAVSQENLQLLERQRRFVQDASHELRTPITVALGHAELLERSLSDAQMLQDVQVVKEELLRLKRQADRLLGLIAYRQPDFLHRTLIEVEPLLVQLLNRWSPTPRRWKLGPMEEARILADSDRLALAVDALIENAVKHTQPDDSIELSARGEGEDVVIAVSDSGTGIADEAQERIFERFVQAPENGSRPNGLGLGLAIVKAVVEAHGGSVRVKSRPGIGTSFELLLARAG